VQAYQRADARQAEFGRGFGRLAGSLQSGGQALTAGLTLPLALMAAQVGKTYIEIDALEKSVSRYGLTLRDIQTIAKAPGLGLEEAAKGSVRLLSVKYNADLTRRALLGIGNALALDGKGKAELDGITLALSQMKGKGKVQAEELNQIAERLPSIRALVQEAFGTADTEQLQKMGITADQFLEKVTQGFEKLPAATKSPKLAYENLTDSIKIGVFQLGRAADNALDFTGSMNSLAQSIEGGVSSFTSLNPSTQKFILYLTGAAVATGPLLAGLGTLIKLFPFVRAGFAAVASPIGVFVAAFALLGTMAYGIYELNKATDVAAQKSAVLADVSQRVASATAQEEAAVIRLVKIGSDKAASDGERLRAINDLNKLSPKFLGFINAETIGTEKATVAVGKYIQALKLKAEATALAAVKAKNEREYAEFKVRPKTDFERPYDIFLFGDQAEQRQGQERARLQNTQYAIERAEAKLDAKAKKLGVDITPPPPVTPGVPPITPGTGKDKTAKTQLQKDEEELKKLVDKIEDLEYRNIEVPIILKVRRDILEENISFAKADGSVLKGETIKPIEKIQKAADPAKTKNLKAAISELGKPIAIEVIDRQRSLQQLQEALSAITGKTGEGLDDLTGAILNKMDGVVNSQTLTALSEEIYSLGDHLEEDLQLTGDQVYTASRTFFDGLKEGFKPGGLTNLFDTSEIDSQMDYFISKLSEKFQEVARMGDKYKKIMATMSESIDQAGKDAGMNAAGSLGEFVGGLVSGQKNGVQQLVSGLFGVLADFLSQLARARAAAGTGLMVAGGLGLAAQIPGSGAMLMRGKALSSMAVGLAVASGVVRGIGAGVGSKLTSMATGGLVSGPTAALVGEYAGAANDPELVGRLSTVTGYIGKAVQENIPKQTAMVTAISPQSVGRQQMSVDVRVRGEVEGSKLLLLQDNAQKSRKDLFG
jgi:tape measure domain-containing protein